MRRKSFSCLFCLLLLVCCLPAGLAAAVEPVAMGRAELANIFQEVVLQNSPWAGQDLRVSGFSSQPGGVTLPPGTFTYRVLSPLEPNRLGRKTVSVAMLVNGKESSRVKLSGDLRLFGKVACAAKKLSRRQVLTRDDIAFVRRDISMLDTRLVRGPEQVVGKLLKTSLQPGAILYSYLLKEPPLVKRGDLVTILAQSGQVRVTVQGEVRDTGALGDLVRVKNLMSRKEIYARVLGDGLVETGFRARPEK